MSINTYQDNEEALKPLRVDEIFYPKMIKDWDCMACDGHGLVIKDNMFFECDACMENFA